MIRDEIVKVIKETVGEKEVHLETPVEESHGDYSTNIAMQLFVRAGEQESGRARAKNPRELAVEIAKKLSKDSKLKHIVSKIEVAGPGFINFFLTRSNLVNEVREVNKQKDKYGSSDFFKGKKVMFEYGQPNTHKLPHIGHLFSYIYGDSMTRLLEATGWEVRRANYQGDVGPHVAKCLWAFLKDKPKIPESLEKKVDLLQKLYQKGNTAYESNTNAKEEIDKLNKAIYNKDEKVSTTWIKTRGWSIDYYKAFEKRLGINFDRYYYESEVGQKGKEKVEQNIDKVFKRSQGALIFEGSKHGLHDRVFVTKHNTPTYEAKDLYLEELKMTEWPMDLLVITTAHEQNEYFKVVFKALETMHPSYKGKLKHIGFGMVSLKSGKISSRKGQIIGAIELVESVVVKVKQITSKSGSLSKTEIDEVAESVGIGAVKYSFLKNNPLQNIKFDVNESIAKEGNSSPYLQYSFARTQSVLQKSKTFKGLSFKGVPGDLNKEELSLLRTFVHFTEVVQEAAENYAPNLMCNYLFDLAQKYNNFYAKHKIVGSENEEFRLTLTSATGQILKNGLYLLGIESPEKM